MKREHSAYFEYFVDEVAGSSSWRWLVQVHRVPAVLKEVQTACFDCRATGIKPGTKDKCPACSGARRLANKVSVPEQMKGTAPTEAEARAAAQKAGSEAVEKHRIPKKSGPVPPIVEGN